MIRATAIAALLVLTAAAQTGPRIVLQPPASAAYSVTLRQGKAAEKPKDDNPEIAVDSGNGDDAKRTVISVEITGETARATTKAADGKTTEVFMFRELFLRFDESTKKVRPYKFDQYAPADMRFTRSFPGIDWVKPAMFKGKVDRNGKPCLHFVQEAGTGEKAPLNKDDQLAYDNRHAAQRREAWFDAATGLPIAFKDGPLEGSYRHDGPAKQQVKLPKPYLDAVKHYYGIK